MTRHLRLDSTAGRIDCDAFARLLADYLEADLRPGPQAAVERHRVECSGCEALVASLDDLRAESMALPDLEPSRDLWAGIEARIGPRIVVLPAAPASRRRDVASLAAASWLRGARAAAAAALFVAAAGAAAYVAGRNPATPPPSMRGAPTFEAAEGTPSTVAGTPRSGASAPLVVANPPATSAPAGAGAAAVPAGRGGGSRAAAAGAPSPAAVAASPFDVEIATLRRTLDARRTVLDTATARAIETNIAILDGAIRESRAALVEEPTSQLLHEQLNFALDAKLELMRTAVILSGDD